MTRTKIEGEAVKITCRIRGDQKEKIVQYRRISLKSQDEQIREALDLYFKKHQIKSEG
jgi:predicted DNA-binding antitoxin AbrB/MazE fold protein